jgi:hypothetical protein
MKPLRAWSAAAALIALYLLVSNMDYQDEVARGHPIAHRLEVGKSRCVNEWHERCFVCEHRLTRDTVRSTMC